MMKYLLAVALVWSSVWAITLTIDSTTQQVDLGSAAPDNGSYDQSFKLTVASKTAGHSADVYVSLSDLLRSADGLDVLPQGALGWKLYYATDWVGSSNWSGYVTGSSPGLNEKVPFYVQAPDRAFQIAGSVNSNFDAMLGLLLRIPAVQPSGRYSGLIEVTVVEN